MMAISETIIKDYQIRKTKKQKDRFINYITEQISQLGYQTRIEKGMFGARNIIVGDIDNAKVIYTAHYDTCPRLPFPNFLTPQNIVIYILYNIAIILSVFLIGGLFGTVFYFTGKYFMLDPIICRKIAAIPFFITYLFLLFGPANKHTVNDNTSGVITLLEIMGSLPKNNQNKVAFVFFDLEEVGLFGSSSFASEHKNIKKNTLLINFDCVSDGDNLLIFAKKKATEAIPLLQECFISNQDLTTQIVTKGIYPSDQSNFDRGIGVACFNKTKKGMLYLDKIHTPKDLVFRQENITFIVNSALQLIEKI